MNSTSKNLGMTQSNWVNPNGLPADEQITSARDLAILGRALLHDFPEYDMYWNIPAIQLGKKYMRNYNTLIGRYEGADGMKTGFICASGFNLVASASRNGKRLIAVVLGSPSSPYRAAKAAGLLERGFHRGPLSWLSPSLGSVDSLQPVNAAPPDLRDEMCGPHRKRPAAEEADDESEASSFMLTNLPPSATKGSALLKERPDTMKAIAVFLGATKAAAENQFANARSKIQKLAKGKKSDGKPAAARNRDHRRQARHSGVAADRHCAAGRRFRPDASKRERAARRLPAANDVSNPALSYRTGKEEPAPLTAIPDTKPEPPWPQATAAPKAKPKPKPKPEAKQATDPKQAAAPKQATAPKRTLL